MLSTCSDPQLRGTWEPVLQQLLRENPAILAEIHAKFAPLYAAVEAAVDEATALSVLLKIPPAGQAN
jgi:hypothetical protein